MGTSYYMQPGNTCYHICENWVHLGKHSHGWRFLFHGYRKGDLNDEYVKAQQATTANEIMALAREGKIFDEYGRAVSLAEFTAVVDAAHGKMPNHAPGIETDERGYQFYYGCFS